MTIRAKIGVGKKLRKGFVIKKGKRNIKENMIK